MIKEKLSVFEAKRYIPQDMQIAVVRCKNSPTKYPVSGTEIFRREFWKIVYIISGNGILKINKHKYPVFPGFVCLIHPDDQTSMELSEDLTLFNIVFLHELIAADLNRLYDAYHFFSIFDHGFRSTNSMNHEQLHLLDSNRNIFSLVKKMAHEYQYQDANSNELLRFQLLELLINLARLSSKSFSKRRRSEISNIIEAYLHQHFQEPLSIQEIADEFGISRGYLFNLYRRDMGKTIGQTLLEIRLNEAKSLLKETNMNIESLCYRCGFSDLGNFYKVFKRNTGCAPGKFRKASAIGLKLDIF